MHSKTATDTVKVRRRKPASARLALSAAGLLALLAAGCSNSPPDPPRPPVMQAASPVPLPPAAEDGPVLTVEGHATWMTAHPGCAELRTGSGQVFNLVGPATEQRLGQVRLGTSPTQQYVRITGYVPRVGATVCGAQRSFVAQQVTSMSE